MMRRTEINEIRQQEAKEDIKEFFKEYTIRDRNNGGNGKRKIRKGWLRFYPVGKISFSYMTNQQQILQNTTDFVEDFESAQNGERCIICLEPIKKLYKGIPAHKGDCYDRYRSLEEFQKQIKEMRLTEEEREAVLEANVSENRRRKFGSLYQAMQNQR